MRRSLLMFATGIALLAAAFVGSHADAGTTARGGVLRINLLADFGGLDPAINYGSAGWLVERVTCATLLWYPDSEDATASRPAPEIALAMPEQSRDGRTYTFKMRRNYRFHTGERITARTFVHSWTRAMSPKLVSPSQHFMEEIEGAQEVFDGKAEQPTGLRALDDWTLQVRLTKVAPDFLARMTMPFFCPVPISTPSDKMIEEAPFPGSGPYYLKDWVKRRSARLVRNPFYDGPRAANVDEIHYTFGVNIEASVLQIDKGEADLGAFPPESVPHLVRTYGLNKGRFFVRKVLVFYYFAFNHDRPLFRGNGRLKRALNMAIDRPALVRQHGYLAGARTDQILPPGMPGYRDWDIYPLKGAAPERAREMLRPGDLRGGKASLIHGNLAVGPLVAQVFQFNAKQIGLDVELRPMHPTVSYTLAGTRGGDWDVFFGGWAADYSDPSNFINVLFLGDDNIRDKNNVNLTYFNDPEFNRRMREAQLLVDDERYDTFALLDRDLMRGPAPVAPYINSNNRSFVSARVKNYKWSPAKGNLLNLITVQ